MKHQGSDKQEPDSRERAKGVVSLWVGLGFCLLRRLELAVARDEAIYVAFLGFAPR